MGNVEIIAKKYKSFTAYFVGFGKYNNEEKEVSVYTLDVLCEDIGSYGRIYKEDRYHYRTNTFLKELGIPKDISDVQEGEELFVNKGALILSRYFNITLRLDNKDFKTTIREAQGRWYCHELLEGANFATEAELLEKIGAYLNLQVEEESALSALKAEFDTKREAILAA